MNINSKTSKKQLIDHITENFSADLIWEIDKEKFYGFIGWNGSSRKESYWLKYSLEVDKDITKKILFELIDELKRVTNSPLNS